MPPTLILHPYLKRPLSKRLPEQQLQEAIGLAAAIDLQIVEASTLPLSRITPASYIGKGTLEQYAAFIAESDISLCIINTQITPIQKRNLENALKCKVIDRTALILEIFGERARTKEGQLQVELAALEYQKSRLVRSWTHLERQRGGGGFLGGPGEKQIESDRRILRERIASIKKQLEKVVKTRQLHRSSRQKIPYPIVALVGYTNAGKSTLFNYLTDAGIKVADQLFATLDPTMRQITLPSGKQVILSDTVGFISELPTQLVAAFRATLEEVVEADILLHIRDITHEDTNAQKEDVLAILEELGLSDAIANSMIEVANKTDQLSCQGKTLLQQKAQENAAIVPVSALTGEGIDKLLQIIDTQLANGEKTRTLHMDASNGKQLAWLHQHGTVLETVPVEDGKKVKVTVRMSSMWWGRIG